MPRVVRNFWVKAEVDGRDIPVTFGPARKDGGFYLTVYVRENGGISDRTLRVHGFVTNGDDGVTRCEVTATCDEGRGEGGNRDIRTIRLSTERG